MRFITELKRRNVFRVATAYAVVAWLLLQLADILLGNFGAPEWVFRSFAALLFLGFPLAVFLAWAYEMTPQGIRKTRDVPVPDSWRRYKGRKLDFVIIGLLSIALTVLVIDRVVWSERSAADDDRVVEAGADEPDPSLAVLPFADMSPGGDQGYFADGLSEEILNLLARGGVLRVTARTSAFAFRDSGASVQEIGSSLGVAHVLEGSVRMSGNRLRITAQLVAADSGFPLWSDSFDRPMSDVFDVQDEIAQAISRALEVTLTGRPAPTEDLAAYDLYLRARQLMYSREAAALLEARDLIEQSLVLDPGYAPALAASAELYLLMAAGRFVFGDMPVDQARSKAESQLETALAIDPELVDAHAAAGLLEMQRRQWSDARAHLETALDINPSHVNANLWLSELLADQGLLMDAIETGRHLREIDPLFIANRLNLSNNLANAGKHDASEVEARALKQAFPDDGRGFIAEAYLRLAQGRLAEALGEIGRGLEIGHSRPSLIFWGELVHLGLGHPERWEDRSVGASRIWAPVARGEVEVGLSRGWQRLATAPGDVRTILPMIEVMSMTGRHAELVQWVDQRWGGARGLYEQVGNSGLNRYLLPLAYAQRDQGREREFSETLALVGERIEHYARNGHDNHWLNFVEIGFLALSDEPERAVGKLGSAVDRGLRDPRLDQWPVLESIQELPEFRRQFERMTELINAERAALGWNPLS